MTLIGMYIAQKKNVWPIMIWYYQQKWYFHAANLIFSIFSISADLIKKGLSQHPISLILKNKKPWIIEIISKHLYSQLKYETAKSEVLII